MAQRGLGAEKRDYWSPGHPVNVFTGCPAAGWLLTGGFGGEILYAEAQLPHSEKTAPGSTAGFVKYGQLGVFSARFARNVRLWDYIFSISVRVWADIRVFLCC